MIWRIRHGVIHLTEQNDKIFGWHWILLSGIGLCPSTEVSSAQLKKALLVN